MKRSFCCFNNIYHHSAAFSLCLFRQDQVRLEPVLESLGNRASDLAAKLPEQPKSHEKWEARRTQVRKELTEVLGLPKREPMKSEIVNTRQQDDLIIEDVIYLWAERAYVSADVIRPKNTNGPLPAVVSPPGWLGWFKMGILQHMGCTTWPNKAT